MCVCWLIFPWVGAGAPHVSCWDCHEKKLSAVSSTASNRVPMPCSFSSAPKGPVVLLALVLHHTTCNPDTSSWAWCTPNFLPKPGALGCFIQRCMWVKFPLLKCCKGQTDDCKWERSPSGDSSCHGPAHTQQNMQQCVCVFCWVCAGQRQEWWNCKMGMGWGTGIQPQGYSLAAPLYCTARLLLPSN